MTEEFLNSAKCGDLNKIKQMIFDGNVSIFCSIDSIDPFSGIEHKSNALYFSILNGHIDVADYLMLITSGTIVNDVVRDDSLVKSVSERGDLNTLEWLQKNIFKRQHEKMVAFISIVHLFKKDEHDLIEKIALHFDINANVVTDNLLVERLRFLKEDSPTYKQDKRDIEILLLTKPKYKVNE